jgi:predicted nucleic acid-binding protein
MTTYIDTSALFAVRDRDDAEHLAAIETWKYLFTSGAELVSSSYVILETTALMQRRLGLDSVRFLHDHIYPRLRIEWVTAPVHDLGMRTLLAADRRRLSLVDCVSFELMRQLGITAVFCFDDHFREQGFDVIPNGSIR